MFALASWVVIASAGSFPLDAATARTVASWRLGDVSLAVPRALEFFGSPSVRAVWTAALAIVLWRWLGPRHALLVLAAAAVFVLTDSIKYLADRQRPAAGSGLNPSFPSGHAAYTASVVGLMVVLLVRHSRPKLACAGLVLIALMGPSRVMLGVHWLSDVLVGYAIGLGWLALVVGFGLPWAETGDQREVATADP